MDTSIASLALEILKLMLSDYPPTDVERYFKLHYRDADMELFVETNSSRAAQAIAEGVAAMLVNKVRLSLEKQQYYLLQ